ncbi:MAG: hypothetical protein E1N59_639 [Puniceicoccaceae bacterium 5H]|nr:MAG: hypothetical protein E1N59_639 [Puniceicoccaceae bacterium 5H]
MSASEVFQRHGELCTQVLDLLQQENHYLREQQAPSAEVVEAKQRLLPQLAESLESIKAVQLRPEERTNQLRTQKQKLEQQLMRIFLLDKENEKLLLEVSQQQRGPKVPPRRASLSAIQKAYRQNLGAPHRPAQGQG